MVRVLDDRRHRSQALRRELAEPLGNHVRSDGRTSRWEHDLKHPCDLYRWHRDAYHSDYLPLMRNHGRHIYRSPHYGRQPISRPDDEHVTRVPLWALVQPFEHDNPWMVGIDQWNDKFSTAMTDGIVETLSVHVNFAWDALSRMTAVVKEVRCKADTDRLDLNAETAARHRHASELQALHAELARLRDQHAADVNTLTGQIAALREEIRLGQQQMVDRIHGHLEVQAAQLRELMNRAARPDAGS